MTRPRIRKLPLLVDGVTKYVRTLCAPDPDGGLLKGDSLLAYRQNWGKAIHDKDYGEDHQAWVGSGEVRNKAYYRKLQTKFGLNCVRLFFYRDIRIEYKKQWFPWREGIPMLNDAVAITKELGMTLIIDYHPTPPGKLNFGLGNPTDNNTDDAWLPPELQSFGAESREFWTEIAPLYADQEHVIYELHNEPIQWSADYLNLYFANDEAIAYQGDMYTLVRNLAPNTPLLLWSFPQARGLATAKKDLLNVVRRDKQIVYKNAAVAIHTYAMNKAAIVKLAAMKPTIITEWTDQSTTPNLASFRKMIAWAEAQQISWIMLNLEWTSRKNGYSN